MNKLKGKFELNKDAIGKMLKSQPVLEVAEKEAKKLGDVETSYIGTQRVWVRGIEE